jgi:hypothetical protein
VIGSATINGTTATVTFSPPATDGGSPITGYVVRGFGYCSNAIDINSGSLSLSHVMANLSPNSPCTFTAHALNSAGEGPGSAQSNAVTYMRPDLYISFPEIPEGNSGTSTLTFTMTLSFPSPSPISFDVATQDGTAVAGSDFVGRSGVHMVIPAGETTASFDVTVNGDTAVEPTETFRINLTNVDGAWVPSTGYAVGTIADDDGVPVPKLSIEDTSFVEGNSGTSQGWVRVSLDIPAPVPVSFDLWTTGGSAIAGQDYVAPSFSTLQIPAGQSSLLVPVTINGDTLVESDENILFDVRNVVGATVVDGAAMAFITNDDTGFTPSLSIGDVTITEGNSGAQNATFTVTLSGAATTAVTYDIATADGSATAGSDYTAKSLTGQSIAAGATSRIFTVSIIGDRVVELGETFKVNISNVTNAHVGDGQAVGTIINDDVAGTPTLSIADASVSEGNSGTKTLTFTVSLSPAATSAVTYNIATSNGTATSGSDYVASSLTGQSIAAGATSKTFAVTINGDTTTESNETFNVTLSGVSGATLGDGSAVGTISNDDGGGATPTLTIADVSLAEGNSLSKTMTFTVKLSAAATGPVTYNIATANGTALAPGDYTAKSLTGQSIAAGATSKNFTVSIKGDTIAEANETFKVNVTSVVGATLGDGQAIGTITNDDAARMSIARFDARGLVDDVDDGNREPQLTAREYASLLLDTATKLCSRTGGAAVVAVDAVENARVLAELADTANAGCAGKRYQAVMGEGQGTGFLVEARAPTDARGAEVLAAPAANATSGVTTLRFLPSGHGRPLQLLVPQALPVAAKARQSQLSAIAQQVRAQLSADADARIVLIGELTVPGLDDLTGKAGLPEAKLPAQRVLVSQSLLGEFRDAHVEFVPQKAGDATPVLQLQR